MSQETDSSDNNTKYWEEEGKRNEVEVEVISKDNIKPAVPTPHHLKTYELSIFGILSFHIYNSFVYFYQNDSHHQIKYDDLHQLLRQSLSETLTRFYPFAGKVQDERRIDCNDDGVYYVEARVNNCSLSDFLKEPNNKFIHRLLPFHPNSNELSSQTCVTMVQVTTFSCGGIAIGLYTSHKLVDWHSHKTFLKAWAVATRGSKNHETICPSFTSPSIFPPILPKPVETGEAFKAFVANQDKCVGTRIVFRGSSLMDLKKKAGVSSTRVTAVTGLIWKCAMAASRKRSVAGGNRASIPAVYNLMIPVNLRHRSSPPMPPYSIGSLTWLPIAQCRENGHDVELNAIVELLKNAIGKVDSDFIEAMKGEEGNLKIWENLNEQKRFYSDGENAEYMFVNSLCNFGTYEADFGWGRPVWASLGDAGADVPILRNVVFLMDTRLGDGIEAWVSLSEGDMALFEHDPELLAFASVNPSPLGPQTVA